MTTTPVDPSTAARPSDYGSVAGDGLDDTAAFIALLQAGGDIYIPAGTYDFFTSTGVLVVLANSINVSAAGAPSS